MVVIHILLGILKIVGILLLVLLGLLLFTLLSLLFAPVRYKARGEKASAYYQGEASISWLFHLVWVKAAYDSRGEGFRLSVRLFGISLEKALSFFANLKTKLKRGKKRKEKKQRDTQKEKEGQELQAAEEALPEKREKAPAEKKEKKVYREPAAAKSVPQENRKKSVPGFWTGIYSKGKKAVLKALGAVRWLYSLPGRLLKLLKKFHFTVQGVCDKIEKIKNFLEMPQVQGARSALLKEGKGLLRHSMPKKIKGRIAFGTEDPCMTGELLAAASIFYPLYGDKISLEPCFDRAVLEGELALKGRVYGICAVLSVLRLLFNQDIRFLYKKYKLH